MNEWIEWGQPTGPPPDDTQPWVWIGDRWVLVVTDAGDGVPQDLSYLDTGKETDHG